MHSSTGRAERGISAVLCAVLVVLSAAGLIATGARGGSANGPDVTVYYLGPPGIDFQVSNFGVSGQGERAYSMGVTACNQGSSPLNWCDQDNCGGGLAAGDHPVIAQNLYRYRDGRFQQIGLSWLKHGIAALTESYPGCGSGTCIPPSILGHTLGVGCGDSYEAGSNGVRPLGMRSEVNATSGAFPFPETEVPFSGALAQRLRVLEADLTTGNGERFFGEMHYVARDDALAGNGLNNASYREMSVHALFELRFMGTPESTVREQPALFAWQAIDPAVEILDVDVLGSVPRERFHVARRVTDLGGGSWHYEYALHNMNSDRAARAFRVRFPRASLSNAGAHFIAHHSGEPYAATPWMLDSSVPGTLRWSTETFAANANANALRWGTTFNFWFDATAGPTRVRHDLELFKPGSFGVLTFFFDDDIFADGFETGDFSAWSLAVP